MLPLGMRNAAGVAALLALGILSGCGGDDEGAFCDRPAAQAALDGASPGTTVTLGACAFDGPLRVPAGVSLSGAGAGRTTVRAPAGTYAIAVEGGDAATPSTVSALTVQVDGAAGLLARGGAVTVRDVNVSATAGVAFGTDSVLDLVVERVVLEGPVTPDNADSPALLRVVPSPAPAGPCPTASCACEPGSTHEDGRVCDASGQWATVSAAYGLYLAGNTVARLTGVDVRGFAAFGAVLRDSRVTWEGGTVESTLGVGVRQIGGSAALTDVAVTQTLQGLRGTPAYAIASTANARLESTRLVVSDNARFGLVQLAGSGAHVDLVGERNGDVALWVGDATDLSVAGAATALRDNAFAAVVVVDSSNVSLADAVVSGTRISERPVGAAGVVRVGDGVHLIGALSTVHLSNVHAASNERAGLVVDLGMLASGGLTFTNVEVEATGTQLGAIAGMPDASGRLVPIAPGTWDTGITRLGDALANDMAARDAIDAVGQIGRAHV